MIYSGVWVQVHVFFFCHLQKMFVTSILLPCRIRSFKIGIFSYPFIFHYEITMRERNRLVVCSTGNTCAKNVRQKYLCYGGRDDISVRTLLEYSQIFCSQKFMDSHIGIKRHFRKHDLNFMNSGVNSITTALFSNPCMQVLFS